MSRIDPGKEIFKLARTDTSSPEEWVKEVELQVSKARGEKTRFTSPKQIAEILVKDIKHADMAEYKASNMARPPCSIAQAANGGPLNCVGRLATLVTIIETRNLLEDLYRHILIKVNVEVKGLGTNKKVKGGHIFGFLRINGEKTYLGEPIDTASTETHRVNMLPVFYKTATAFALGVEGNEEKAKQLAKEAKKQSQGESSYINHSTNKIINY